MSSMRTGLADEVLRHASAARAHHTGLLAETDRLVGVLRKLAQHLSVIRERGPNLSEKINAAEESCCHLRSIETLRSAWGESYVDLRRSVRRLRFHLKRLAASKRPRS